VIILEDLLNMNDFITQLFDMKRQNIETLDKLSELSKSDLTRIISNIDDDFLDDTNFDSTKQNCWLWIGNIQDESKGHSHPSIHFMKKKVLVHRLMYHNFIDKVPKYERKSGSLQVNHKCGHKQNGKCVNPWHMYLGTPKDNMQDALREGTKYRAPCGDQNRLSKLSNNQVQEIINMKGKTTMSQKEIASMYNIHQSQISRWWNKITRK